MGPRVVILLDLFEQAKHGIIVRHYRRSDDDRALCKKRFRIGSSVHGWSRECVQCVRMAREFEAQQQAELAKFAQAQQPIEGKVRDGA